MQLVVKPQGEVRAIYDETVDLTQLGQLRIRRASQVEPDAAGCWLADLRDRGWTGVGALYKSQSGPVRRS